MKSNLKFKIPSGANEIIHTLQNKGYEAYLVGGCVRDNILKRPVHDYDITTSATPDEMIEIFEDKKIIETGLQHGTITVVIDEVPYEVTTYRIDGSYSDNRRPDNVTFTKSLEEDLKRRDFTINAMAYNDKVGLIDPFNGMDDIKNCEIRCVGNAKDRFSEDALRILRAIRFAGQLNFDIEFNTSENVQVMCESLKNISVERINNEFCKIVLSNDFSQLLVSYASVFLVFVPELEDMFGFQQNNPYHDYDVWLHTLVAIDHCESNDLITRLAVLFHDIGKPHCYQDDDEDWTRHFRGHGDVSAKMTNKIMRRLRFDNDTREKVVELIRYHDSTIEVGEKYIKRWLNKIGVDQFRRLLDIRRADILAQSPQYKEERIEKLNEISVLLDKVLSKKTCFTLRNLAVNGNDVKQVMHLETGKDVGCWLNEILKRVIDGDLKNEKEEIIHWMTGVTDGWIKYEK